jgi:hypothetical protein
MSSQAMDICAPGVEEAGAVIMEEESRIKLGGLWPEDFARIRYQNDGYKIVDYGIEEDGFHYWAELVRRG